MRAPFDLRLQAVDVVVVAALVLVAALAAAFAHRVEGWVSLAAGNLAVAALFLASVATASRMRRGAVWFVFRTASVTAAFAWLFAAVAPLQLVIHGRWLDDSVIALERWLLGGQPVLWLEPFVRPWLTEWMMFAYVVYVALYPLVCGAIWLRHGERAVEASFLTLGLANVACDVSFILFPVAGPTAWLGDRFAVPLGGGTFADFGEFVRAELQYIGGSLPSPHCAAATVLWIMAWRYHRRLALVLVPIVCTLYVSTVYGRFHYATDAIAGILVALISVAAAPSFCRWWAGRTAPGRPQVP